MSIPDALRMLKKKSEKCHCCQQMKFEFVCIFMRWPDFTGGIPVVPSNFYPSLEQLSFKVVFFFCIKRSERGLLMLLRNIFGEK